VAATPRDLDPAPFHFGVASGDPLHDRVLIWTRAAPRAKSSAVDVRWTVARDPDLRRVVRRGRVVALAENDHTVTVDVAGLDPGTRYYYGFEALGERSRVGRTATLPESARHLRLVIASCQSYPDGYYAAWRHIASKDLDAVLHLGDYIYEYGSTVEGFGEALRPHRPDYEIVSLADYRLRYANYRSDPHLRAAHAAHPFICVWDDHEVANDRWKDGAENHQPEEEGDYEDRRRAAYRAYFEWMPLRRPDEREPDRIYRSFSVGDLADLFMLDTRSYRDEVIGTFLAPNVDPVYTDPDRTILGDRQERWLHRSLARSRARWRLVGNQVMIAPFSYGAIPDALGRPLQDLTGVSKDGAPVNHDAWDGYQHDRNQLLEHISSAGIDNTLFLTGDIHTSWAIELKLDPDDPTQAPVAAEFVGPSVSSANLDDITGAPPRTASRAAEAAVMANNLHVRYVELDSHGYALITVTEDAIRGDWYFVDKTDASAGEELATSWVMRDGNARLEQP
jgi:alkaline phosphatase D